MHGLNCKLQFEREHAMLILDLSLGVLTGFELPWEVEGEGGGVNSPPLGADPVDYATDPSGEGVEKPTDFKQLGVFKRNTRIMFLLNGIVRECVTYMCVAKSALGVRKLVFGEAGIFPFDKNVKMARQNVGRNLVIRIKLTING